MTTEGNDPNAGNDGAEGAAKLDEKTQNAIHAAVRVQLAKGLEAAIKPFREENAALKAELGELKGKGAAGQESGGKPSGKTEAELQIEAMRRKVDELTADNERTKREAQEQRVKNALFAEANGKVRKDMAENFVMLAQSRVKTASDGTLSLDIDGQSYDVKTGVETLLKSNSFAGFNQPVQPPNRSAKDPANGANSFNLQSVDVEKISGSELGERLLKPTA